MHQLGLTFAFAVSLTALGGCRTSEPAQGAPPASATSVAPPVGSVTAVADAGAPASSATATATATATPSSAPVYDETTHSVDAHAGDQFVVALPAHAGAAFRWRLEPPPDATLLALADRKYSDAPPKGCAGCTGYGGTDAFTFVASGAGTTTLHFAYVHVGRQPPPPAKEVTIDVHVTAK